MTRVWISLGLLPTALLFGACGSEDPPAGGKATGQCMPTSPDCYVAGPTGPGAECLAKHDNTGQDVWQGRISQITVSTPSVLATKFIHDTILDLGINFAQPACFEKGDGTFSWLFHFDRTAKKLKTGGSLPVTDPKSGGCFLTRNDLALPIAPIEVDVEMTNGDRDFSASNIDVVVPIFQKADQLDTPILLPLHAVDLKGSFTDDSHNCIGSYNGPTLYPELSCQGDFGDADPTVRRRFQAGATLKGYIRIDEADQVFIDVLDVTLCVYLAGITKWGDGAQKSCASSAAWLGGERPAGDWCSTTNAAATADCKDAWRLEAEFAASAFKVNGDCP